MKTTRRIFRANLREHCDTKPSLWQRFVEANFEKNDFDNPIDQYWWVIALVFIAGCTVWAACSPDSDEQKARIALETQKVVNW